MNIYCKNRSVRHCGAGRFLIVFSVLLLAGCRPQAPTHLAGKAQGTYYSILYRDPQGRNLQTQVDSLLNDFDQMASLWVDTSLLRRVNANLTTDITPRFAALLDHSDSIRRYTGGAFDVRIGRLVQAWGFSFRQREELAQSTLDSLLRAARCEVAVEGLQIKKQCPGTELDFNAIAQGYSSDLVAAFFDSLGIENYLIDIGGEVVARGDKGRGQPWRVGIEKPAEDRYSDPIVQTAIALSDKAVVTSGSYRKYYEKDGVRYSHTIDPATGRPVTHSLLSVSVVERDCWLADAMATAYMVMGLERAKQFIADHPDGPGTEAVMFIYDDGGTLATYATSGFEKLEENK